MKPEDPTECRQTHFREGGGLGTRLRAAWCSKSSKMGVGLFTEFCTQTEYLKS